MDSRKNGNLAKLVAFFLIVTVLVMAIAFSASGWQGDDSVKPDSGNAPTGGEADENTDGNDTQTNTEPTAPAYTHYISGLGIDESESLLAPLCILYDTEAPMYGISSAFLTVELPIEGGKTRLLAFTNKATNIGKIGALAPTRKYISNVALYFGGIPVFIGDDDSFPYSSVFSDSTVIDLNTSAGYYYTEYGTYRYTNADLLSSYIKNNSISTVMSSAPQMPYVFTDSINTARGTIKANTALIQFDKGSTSELIYSASDAKYKLQKNSSALSDRHDDSELNYDNVFILFSDAATYETSDSTELILDTVSGGHGYYLNGGLAKRIVWSTTESGELQFKDEEGKTLEILPGSSYMAFAKSSYAPYTKLA